MVRGPAQGRTNGQVKIVARPSGQVMGVVLELWPGKARQLDRVANVIDGGNIQIAGNPIGGGRIAMSRIAPPTQPEADRRRFELHQVSNTRV